MEQCLNCARPESETPLITLRLQTRTVYICPQCLPALIHHPEQIAAKVEEAAGARKPGT